MDISDQIKWFSIIPQLPCGLFGPFGPLFFRSPEQFLANAGNGITIIDMSVLFKQKKLIIGGKSEIVAACAPLMEGPGSQRH